MKGYKYIVTAQGSYPFPIDMLRYDRCSPHRETDSNTIRHTMMHDCVPQSVEVVKFTKSAKWEPTHGRWQSQGWKITSVVREQVDLGIL